MNFIENILESNLSINFNPKKNNKSLSFINVGNMSLDYPSYGDVDSLTRIFENLEIVYRCVSIIAENIASLPKKVVAKDNKGNKVDASELFPVLFKPNDFQSEIDFWIESIVRLKLQGELFWEFVLSNSNEIVSIFADWESKNVTIVPDSKSKISLYKYTINGKTFKFSPEEVFYMRYFNPYDQLRGLSPLKAGRKTVVNDLNVISFNNSFFKQGLKLSGILQTEQSLDEAEADRLRNRFEKLYTGDGNMHKTAVLHSGLSFVPLNELSITDADFLELRKYNKESIAMLYGVPFEILSIGKSTYQNEKYARKKFWTETLIPEINKLSSSINTFLIPKLSKKFQKQGIKFLFEFDLTNVDALKEDRLNKIKEYKIGVDSGALTINEMRSDIFNKDAFKDEIFNQSLVMLESKDPFNKTINFLEEITKKKRELY